MLLAGMMGVSQALIFPSVLALLASQIPGAYLGSGLGIVGTLNNAGKVLGPLCGGLLIQVWGFSQALQFLGLLTGVGAIIIWSFKKPNSDLNLSSIPQPESEQPIPKMREIL